MKFLRIFTTLILFAIFFIWSFGGKYTGLVVPLFPWFFVFFIPALIILLMPSISDKILRLFTFSEKHSFKIFPAIAFVFSLSVSLFVFDGLPHVQDEINYRYLAQAILNGSLTSPLHPHYEFFDFLYIVPGISRVYSIYQPGYSTLLAVFILLRIPFLLNPLLTAGTVFLLGKITEMLYGIRTAALSMFLASISLFLMSMGGTWMAHSFCAFCIMGGIYFSIRNFKKFSFKNTFISLLFLIALMFTRPQNALFIFIPLAVWLFFTLKFRDFLRYTVASLIIFIPAVLLLYYSNYVITGKMFEIKHKAFFNYTEPDDNCMGLGLYKGCHHSTAIELPDEGLTVGHAFYITHLRLEHLVYSLFFHPLIFIFIPLLFLFRGDRKRKTTDFFILLFFMITFIGYFFYYYDGNVYGPRYYYEISFFLIILAARGILSLTEKIKKNSVNPLLRPANLFSAFFIAGILYQSVITSPAVYKIYGTAFWGTYSKLSGILEKNGITDGVVFIGPDIFYGSGVALMDLSDIDNNRLIFAHDLGSAENGRLMDYYPGRKYYRVYFNKIWYEAQQPEITELYRKDLPNTIHIEMENKKYPLKGVPDYCNKYPAWPYIDKYAGFNPDSSIIAGKEFYFCRFKKPEEFYSFGQYLKESGEYDVNINVLKTPESGKFLISSGDSKETVDFFNESDIYDTVTIRMFFKKGFNLITFEPLKHPENSYRYFIIDSIDLKTVE